MATIQTRPTTSCMIRYRMAAGVARTFVAAVSMCFLPVGADHGSRRHPLVLRGRAFVRCRVAQTAETTRLAQLVQLVSPACHRGIARRTFPERFLQRSS